MGLATSKSASANGWVYTKVKRCGVSWKVGFGIAFAIVAVFAAALIYSMMPTGVGQASSATTARGFMDPIKVGAKPAGLLPPVAGFGAGALYKQAYQKLQALAPGRHALRRINHNADPTGDPTLVAILTLLEKAAGKGLTRPHLLFYVHPPLPKVNDEVQSRLETLSTLTSQAGAAYEFAHHPKRARAAFSAGLSFGYRLWKKGLYVPERMVGLDAMENALAGLRFLYQKGPLENMYLDHSVLKLNRHVKAALAKWDAKYQIVHNVSPFAPDLINIIRHDHDISWRIAAITSLGVARWATSNAGKARAMLEFLQKESRSNNGWISAAAKQAAAFTRTTINSLSD